MSDCQIFFRYKKTEQLEVIVSDTDAKQRLADFFNLAENRYLLEEFAIYTGLNIDNVFCDDISSCISNLGISNVELSIDEEILSLL